VSLVGLASEFITGRRAAGEMFLCNFLTLRKLRKVNPEKMQQNMYKIKERFKQIGSAIAYNMNNER